MIFGTWKDPGFRVMTKAIPRGATFAWLVGGQMNDVAPELEETFSA